MCRLFVVAFVVIALAAFPAIAITTQPLDHTPAIATSPPLMSAMSVHQPALIQDTTNSITTRRRRTKGATNGQALPTRISTRHKWSCWGATIILRI